MRKSFGIKSLLILMTVIALLCCFYHRETVFIRQETGVHVWIGPPGGVAGKHVDIYGRRKGEKYELLATNVPITVSHEIERPASLGAELIGRMGIGVTPWQKHRLKGCVDYQWIVTDVDYIDPSFALDRTARLREFNETLEERE